MMRDEERRSSAETMCCASCSCGTQKLDDIELNGSMADIVAVARMMCCASCGKSELDDVKLMACDDCKSVRYCSDACQQDHREQHEVKCKEYQAAELRDEVLFRQPESAHLGDCPICCLPLPIEEEKRSLYLCCSKLICNGCFFADNDVHKCPFCRQSLPKTDEEGEKNLMKRAEANDPVAIREMGVINDFRDEYDKAFGCYKRAAELGDVEAHYNLSILYENGQGVEKDEKKDVYHLEEAAVAGHPMARHYLGCHEEKNYRFERAVKHWIIAANLGLDESINALKQCYKHGYVSKEDFAKTLRAHHSAVNAMKSSQREEAEKFFPANGSEGMR